ncbi:MAG TPA: hypothetical protein VFA33_07595 [Bryobacteraceae bacterium]|nr:hypothetical protein [Bryobacteraceae bacterium]
MLDASIPLAVRPAPVENPMEVYGRVLALRGMLQQQQLHNEQLHAYQLENQQRQREMDAQQTLGRLLDQHSAIDPAGNLVTDSAAVMKGLGAAGYGSEALKYDTARRANLKSAFDAAEAQVKLNGTRAGRLGSLFGAVLGADPASRPQAYQTAVQQAVNERLLDPQKAQEMLSHPYGPDLEASMQRFQDQAMTAQQQHQAALATLREMREKAVSDSIIARNQSTTAKNQADLAQTNRQNAAGILAAAPDQAGYAKVWYGLDAKVRDQFPHPDDWDEDTAQQVGRIGMTPAQQTQADREAQMEEHQAQLEKQGWARIGLERQRVSAELQRLNAANGTGPIDRREADRLLARLAPVENGLNRQRKQLGAAIAGTKENDGTVNHKLYVDRLGNVKPMAAASQGDEETAAALVEEMRGRYGDVTDELKRTIADKNSLLQRSGRQVGVATEDAWAALDAGDAKLFGTGRPANGPQQSAGTPAPAQAGLQTAGTPAAKPTAPVPSKTAAPQQYKINGASYTVGQTIVSGGKRYKFLGLKPNGKVSAEPLD